MFAASQAAASSSKVHVVDQSRCSYHDLALMLARIIRSDVCFAGFSICDPAWHRADDALCCAGRVSRAQRRRFAELPPAGATHCIHVSMMVLSVILAEEGMQARISGYSNDFQMDSPSTSCRRHVRRRARSARAGQTTRTRTMLRGLPRRSRTRPPPSRPPRLARPQCRSRSRRKLAQRQR